ncbi:hypothetical protein Tco_0011462 [Tanacetum coccineum]
MSQAEQRDFMRTFVKNQSSAIYNKGWTMTYVKSLSADRLKEAFERLQSHLSTLTQQDFTRTSKRLGDELEQPSSTRPKHAEVEATSAAMEDTSAQLLIPSKDVRTSKESEVVEENVESSERTPRKRKFVARKGLHISKSTIPIETGDPDAEHKICLKYASDEGGDSDSDTFVPFYAIVDWELLPTWLGTINVIYRKDKSLKYFTILWEILHLEAGGVGLILWGDLRVLIDSPEVDDGISGLVIYMFVDKKYPLTVKLMERMLDYQLEIGHGAVGNELTTAVQLVKFLKKQIADSKRAGVHDCCGGCILFAKYKLMNADKTIHLILKFQDYSTMVQNDYFNPHGAQDEALSLKLDLEARSQGVVRPEGNILLLNDPKTVDLSCSREVNRDLVTVSSW